MEIYTVGFTKHTAEEFFESLKEAGIEQLIDVRLNNSSQLAGFAKRDDLRYFLERICGAEYLHEPRLAPTQGLLDAFKKQKGAWDVYEEGFLELMTQRRIEDLLPRSLFDRRAVLLCSEHTPELCHRRLVVEYLNERWGDITAVHL
jgi:uncharacterized protein (DUF488 family)